LRIAFPFAGDAADEESEPIGPLGVARSQISQGRWDQAIETLADAATDDPHAASLLGRVYAQQNDAERLDAWASSSAPAQDDDVDAWFAWGKHHALVGQHEAAVRCFCEVVLLDPTDSDAYRLLSESLQQIDALDLSNAAARRSELIGLTQSIGSEMASSTTRNQDRTTELIQALEQLRRQGESLAWRAVQLAYEKPSLTDQEVRQRMTEINQSRAELLSSDQPDTSEDFILCGVDLQSLRQSP
jgi:tetratricopeptide (TPR) repeat protein